MGDGKSPPQEDALEPFPSVRCAPPASRELPGTMQKHERDMGCVGGDLILYIRMIPVKCLPVRCPFQRIEPAGMLYHGSTDYETSLIPDTDWFGPSTRISWCYRLSHMITPGHSLSGSCFGRLCCGRVLIFRCIFRYSMNKILFLVGLCIALTSAALLFFGLIEPGPAAVIGIVGIGLIGASGMSHIRRL